MSVKETIMVKASILESNEIIKARLKDTDSNVKVGFTDAVVISSGDNNYNNLINKPQIQGVELIGNKTMEQLGFDKLSNGELESLLI